MLKPVKEIIYVFMRGQGWVPTVVREDVRDLHVRLAAKPINFGRATIGWATTTYRNNNYDWEDDF